MKTIQGLLVVWVGISLALSGCSRTRGDDSSLSDDSPLQPVFPFNEPIVVGDPEANPADAYLVTSDEGKVFLSWTAERSDGKGRNVLIASVTSNGQQLSEIRQMNEEPISGHGGENLAKFAVAPGEKVAAIWNPFSVEQGHPGLPLKLTHAEGGGSFSPETDLNDDTKEVHRANFSTIGTSPDGKIFAAWLDGRNDLEAKQLFMGISEDGRTFNKNYSIAPAACPCCRPSIGFLDGGQTVVVAYRENALPSGYINPDNVRDHVMIRSTDGGETFSDPVPISDDGWVPIGCPHTGISIDVDNQDRIHALWWTGGRADDEAGIYYTYSEDGGESFAPRQLISKTEADTVLHTQVAADKNDTLYAAWVGIREERPQILLAHRSVGQGEWSPIYHASNTTWNAIYPMVTVDDKRLYVAWTEKKGEASQVKLRTAPLVEN